MSEISKSDRIELRRVVKRRFELLREEMTQRANELTTVIDKQIRDESAADIKVAEQRSKKITANLLKVEKEIENLHKDMKERGLGAAYNYAGNRNDLHQIIGYFLKGWSPIKLSERVRDRVGEMQNAHGLANNTLSRKELDLIEDLSTDAIEGPAAKEFLKKIPDIDTLLPLPVVKTKKAIKA